jgi:hypothetical protein
VALNFISILFFILFFFIFGSKWKSLGCKSIFSSSEEDWEFYSEEKFSNTLSSNYFYEIDANKELFNW